MFISYASNDYARASAVCCYLEEHGLGCWIAPRDINNDLLPYTQAIERGLSQVRSVVVLISELANLSVHIPRELDMALERKLPIVPIRLQDVQPAGQLNYMLRTCQWLNAFEGAWSGACAELLLRLNQIEG
ncbi:MAG: toll/interleukin-1 receptor domain-containing protein [Candidatus Accumulibacter sp.]|nr:toll/interleukin-1 receptor domain-containing protein [Accumulibacter sp.]